MKRIIFVLALMGLVIVTANQSSAATTKWNTTKCIQVKKGGFTFYAYKSKDKKQSWIHQVKVQPKKGKISTLKFPSKIQGVKVTRLGYNQKRNGSDSEFGKSIFGIWVEIAHNVDGYMGNLKKVKKLVLPSGLKQIDSVCFSGMTKITKVMLPKTVQKMETGAFYGCRNLKSFTFSKNYKEFNSYAFGACEKLKKLSVAKGNTRFSITNNLVIEKQDGKLVWIAPAVEKAVIPSTVKILGKGCLEDSRIRELTIPNTVTQIEKASLKASYLKKITLAPGNTAYAMDGQCIYKLSNNALTVAIVSGSTLKISDKVQEINEDSMVSGDGYVRNDGSNLKVLDIAASVKYLRGRWISFCYMTTGGIVYFRGTTPPELVDMDLEGGLAALPVFMKVYVPQASLSAYTEWYKKYECYQFLDGDKINTF